MITRNNYEEFFLLYVDNELSAAESEAVEQFVRDNPDLEAELTQLQQSVSRPDDGLFFRDKESLLRDTMAVEPGPEESLLRGELPVWAGETSFIDEGNYPVFLLSYLDNELDEESRKIVADHLLLHPRLEEELAILQQTRLEPDPSIVFPGKELLYKPEYSERGAILSWSRMAAAILLLVAGLLLFNKTKQRAWKSFSSVPSVEKNLQKNPPAVTPTMADPLYSKKGAPAKQREAPVKGAPVKEAPVKEKETMTEMAANPGSGQPGSARQLFPAKQIRRQAKENPVATTGPVDKTPGPAAAPDSLLLTRVSVPPSTTRGAIGETSRKANHEATGNEANHGATGNGSKDNAIAIAKDNTIVLASEGIPIEDPSAIKKNKLRGLFRRVSRVFEKTTNADDDNDNNKHGVLIGSFQVVL